MYSLSAKSHNIIHHHNYHIIIYQLYYEHNINSNYYYKPKNFRIPQLFNTRNTSICKFPKRARALYIDVLLKFQSVKVIQNGANNGPIHNHML